MSFLVSMELAAMRKSAQLAATVIFLVIAASAPAIAQANADAKSNHEFRAQVASVFQSYRTGDTTTGHKLICSFACRILQAGSPST